MMRFENGKTIALAIALGSLLALPAPGQVTSVRQIPEPQPYFRDSGLLSNAKESPEILHREAVKIGGAVWIRVYFGEVELGPGSFIRIRSRLDGEVQELDRAALDAWSRASAYFNGDALDVELVGGTRTQRNRLVIEKLSWEMREPGGGGCSWPCAICGADNRVPSTEPWAARLVISGVGYCSASLWSPDSCFVSAGHCMGSSMVLQFNVPNSTSTCNPVNPGVADQFPVTSYDYSLGAHNDWAVMRAGVNNLNETPYDRYHTYRAMGGTPAVGASVQVWGYGIDTECTKTLTQQTAGGSINVVNSNSFTQSVDMSCANSGSGINRNGSLIGIFTHCGCPSLSTRIDHPDFVDARDTLCPQVCGDDALGVGEECDGPDLDGATCGDYACLSGTPSCGEDCRLDFSTCGCCDGTITASGDHGDFRNTASAYDGDEGTYAMGGYGGTDPTTVAHAFTFPPLGSRSGTLRAVISNHDSVGDESLTTVAYSVDGVNFVTFGQTHGSTATAFTTQLANVDLTMLQVLVTGTADTNPPPAPAGVARVYEIDFTYVEPDGDGVGHGDNCPCTYNPDQFDYDQDGIGHACDNCPFFYSLDQSDHNGNGIGDVCECTLQKPCDDGIPCTHDECLFDIGNPIGMCKITSEGC